MQHADFTSDSSDGLNEVVHGALAAVSGDNDPIGILELSSEGDGAAIPQLSVESSFALRDGRQVFGVLGARACCRAPSLEEELELVRQGLARFGGQRYTSLTGCDPDAGQPRDAFDITVSFPSRVPLFAANTCLVETDLSEREREGLRAVLDALGVRRWEQDGSVVVPHRQLRAPMNVEQQVRAYAAARSAGLRCSLYAALVPAAQSLRVEHNGASGAEAILDVFVGRGLSASRFCTSADAKEITTFLRAWLGVGFGGRSWHVENCAGQPREEAAPPRGLTIAKRPRRRYS